MSPTAEPPAVADLVPQRGAMCLLDEITGREAGGVTCAARVRPGCPLLVGGALPAWALLEYVAQAAAALRGLEGGPVAGGALAAIRDATLDPSPLSVGAALEVQVRREGPARGGLALLAGAVRAGGRTICTARIVVSEG